MNVQVLKNLLAFLERTQLQGREAPAYADAYNLVQRMIQSAEASAATTAVPAGIRGSEGLVGPYANAPAAVATVLEE
jgi:hypothetical protein